MLLTPYLVRPSHRRRCIHHGELSIACASLYLLPGGTSALLCSRLRALSNCRRVEVPGLIISVRRSAEGFTAESIRIPAGMSERRFVTDPSPFHHPPIALYINTPTIQHLCWRTSMCYLGLETYHSQSRLRQRSPHSLWIIQLLNDNNIRL